LTGLNSLAYRESLRFLYGAALDRLLRATFNTWNGLVAATRSEAAFRQELMVLAAAVPLAFFVGSDGWKALALIASVVLILIIELINTAIEKLADFIMPAHDPRIGRIKDMGSAAVALAILIAGLVWLLALGEWLF
jgi:diacylglycerol kinase (ATP)